MTLAVLYILNLLLSSLCKILKTNKMHPHLHLQFCSRLNKAVLALAILTYTMRSTVYQCGLCVLTIVACFSQPVHCHELHRESAASHTVPSQRNMPNEQTSQPVKPSHPSFFLLLALAFSFLPSLPSPCCRLLFIYLFNYFLVLALIHTSDKTSVGAQYDVVSQGWQCGSHQWSMHTYTHADAHTVNEKLLGQPPRERFHKQQ